MTNAVIDGLFNVKRTRQFAGEIGTATLYKWMNEGTFPKPIKIGANRVAWRLSDLEAWRDSLPTAEYRTSKAAA
jgi:predicted DNA-binding transcriptional regulator AlpA